MQSLLATGGLSHINCTRVATSRMQIVPQWLQVACKLYPCGRQSHATWIKLIEICMRLAATWLQDKRQADKRCVTGFIYIIILVFLALASPHSRPCFWLFRWRPLDIWFGKCAGNIDDKAARKQNLYVLAASCMQSPQFFASKQWEQLFE